MNLPKITDSIKDARTIYGFVLAMLIAAGWLGDTRWVTKVEAAQTITAQQKLIKNAEIRQIIRQIQELKLELGFETDPVTRRKMQAKINFKGLEIQKLEGE